MMGSPCRQSDEPNRARSRLFVSSRTFCLAQYRPGAARERQPRDPLGRQTIFNEYLLRNGRQNLSLVSQTPRRRGSFVLVPSAPSAEFYEGSDLNFEIVIPLLAIFVTIGIVFILVTRDAAD